MYLVCCVSHIHSFYDMAKRTVEASGDKKITLGDIKDQMGPLMYELSSMKFQNSNEKSEEEIKAHFDKVHLGVEGSVLPGT